jgi:2-(1,2-epoxy-1,2-dihydrophenyl)acetyl-CoA isomerase
MSNHSGEALPTGTRHLLAARAGGVLTLTLNRPEARNAFSREMLDGLAAMLDFAAASGDVRAVVVAGAGGAFCAGGDLAKLAAGESIFGPADDPGARLAAQKALQRATVVRLRRLDKPSVALVDGAAVGAGLGLALACDLRYAGTSATLRTGFGRIGLAGDFGCTWQLTRLLGASRALELLYLSPALTAARARELGLVNEAVPDDELADRVAEVARRLAGLSPDAVRAMKEHVARAHDHDLADCADAEAAWHVRLLESGAHREAVRAIAPGRARPVHTSSDLDDSGAERP